MPALAGARGLGLKLDHTLVMTGLDRSKDWPLAKLLGTESPDATADLRDERLVKKDQGQTQSCTGHGVVQAVRADVLAHGSYLPDLSALHNYGLGRAEWGGQKVDDGSYVRTGIRAGERYGFTDENLWPFHEGEHDGRPNWVNAQPDWLAMKDGVSRRRSEKSGIGGYYRIADGDVAGMHRALSARHPVVGGWPVTRAVERWDGRGVLEYDPKAAIVGYHCLPLLAFFPDQTNWLLGSWGPNYGIAGYHVVSDEWLAQGEDLWVIVYRTRS